MPYGKCPLCGQISHITANLPVGGIKEWYERYYPGIPQGSLLPAKCFYCWQELKLGDSVVVRKVFAEDPNPRTGEVGVIKDILTADDGSLFLVGLNSGKEVYMIRAQIRKLREGEGPPQRSAD